MSLLLSHWYPGSGVVLDLSIPDLCPLLTLENTILSVKMVTYDRLTCNVNRVYMILVISIYAFLITMGLFI